MPGAILQQLVLAEGLLQLADGNKSPRPTLLDWMMPLRPEALTKAGLGRPGGCCHHAESSKSCSPYRYSLADLSSQFQHFVKGV